MSIDPCDPFEATKARREEYQRSQDGGNKFDADKPMMDLLPWRAVIGVAKVLTYGAKKYGAHNWTKGIKISRLYAAALRHLVAWWLGEECDTESGLPHLDHAICDLMMVREMRTLHPAEDDRPVSDRMKWEETKT